MSREFHFVCIDFIPRQTIFRVLFVSSKVVQWPVQFSKQQRRPYRTFVPTDVSIRILQKWSLSDAWDFGTQAQDSASKLSERQLGTCSLFIPSKPFFEF